MRKRAALPKLSRVVRADAEHAYRLVAEEVAAHVQAAMAGRGVGAADVADACPAVHARDMETAMMGNGVPHLRYLVEIGLALGMDVRVVLQARKE